MIRVAFLLNFSKEYKGGINYIKNLLYANYVAGFPDIEYFIIVPANIEQDYVDIFMPYATVIRTDILKPKTLSWFINRSFNKLFKCQLLLYRLLKSYHIDVVSHSFFWGRYKSLKIINWIPDFQCLHFPELWPGNQLSLINSINENIVKHSDIVIVSSNDALNDYKSFAKDYMSKVRVLQFVSQPGKIENVESVFDEMVSKYNLPNRFFYLPNQFWSHKNHIVVIKALNKLLKQGENIVVVTTGVMNDFRGSSKSLEEIRSYINVNALETNFLMLGVIPYNEVLTFMRKAVAVINPSFFEGWSSTVEEAKSVGQKIILSDIAVHKEQNPDYAYYFNPNNEDELAGILSKVWDEHNIKSLDYDKDKAAALAADLTERTKAFGTNYHNIVVKLLNR